MTCAWCCKAIEEPEQSVFRYWENIEEPDANWHPECFVKHLAYIDLQHGQRV